MRKLFTLCIVHDGRRVLLGMKKRGFGKKRWNGFGGKLRAGESFEQAAEREVFEEAGIWPRDLLSRGVLTFQFTHDPVALEVHLFSTHRFEGIPRETDEMEPRWFLFDAIPYQEMWADDRYWLPLLLEGKNIRGEFFFKDEQTLLRHHIAIV